MSDLSTLARPYARAAYEYAVEQNACEAWTQVLQGLAEIASNKRVQHYLSNPELTTAQMAEIFFDIGRELFATGLAGLKNFILVLAEAKRLVLLQHIAEIFLELQHRDQAILAIHVTAAEPLSAAIKQNMQQVLEQRFKKTVELHCATDPTLLGGAIIRADDEDFVIDGSVRGKLQRLERILIG